MFDSKLISGNKPFGEVFNFNNENKNEMPSLFPEINKNKEETKIDIDKNKNPFIFNNDNNNNNTLFGNSSLFGNNQEKEKDNNKLFGVSNTVILIILNQKVYLEKIYLVIIKQKDKKMKTIHFQVFSMTIKTKIINQIYFPAVLYLEIQIFSLIHLTMKITKKK